jgi:hypothetical protein
MFLVLQAVFALSFASAQEGEGCGIIPTEVIDPNYQPPPVRVGGTPGCTIGSSTDCYCSAALDGEVDNGEWKWHCGDNVAFGPVGNKTCPTDLPDGECDPNLYPNGGPGDPGCGYGDCDGAATFSALCGCIDLNLWGQGNGYVWTCLESTCDCPQNTSTTSSAAMVAVSVISFGLLLAVGLWV